MKNSLFLLLFITGIALQFGQTYDKDSISDGQYSIEIDPIIDSFIQHNIKNNCHKSENTNNATASKNTASDPCFQNQKKMGYKIQVMYTKDRNIANRTKIEFENNFPNLSPEMVYTQPDYRVMAGDYFTKRSASEDLKVVKRKYPGAFLVNWRVWCRKAK